MSMLLRSVAVASAVFMSAAGFQAQAASKTLEYTVLRDGKPIGTHAYTIDTNGADTHVQVSTDIQVKVLFITAYKFKHASEEMWSNGQLVSLNSTTDDDGTDKALTAKAENGKITLDSIVKGQDRRQFAAAAAIPASLWNRAIVTQSSIVNTLDGKLMKVDVADAGTEQIDAGGSKITAQHYKISGELTRDVWFDDAGRLVRVSFPDKTSTEIVYALN